MSDESKPRDFWLEIVTQYGDPCDFIHDHDPKVRARANGTHDCYGTLTHVIEYSAYKAMKEKLDIAVEALKFYSEHSIPLATVSNGTTANEALKKIEGMG